MGGSSRLGTFLASVGSMTSCTSTKWWLDQICYNATTYMAEVPAASHSMDCTALRWSDYSQSG